jgi:MerR family transcriptional regulator, thiopeptide resistance regulator
MEEIMKVYTVSRLAKLAGVSVRTLHHYDEIGLLKPSFRSESGYRKYQRKDLLRLQQILFYRELDFSLTEIKDILDDPEYDEIKVLKDHRNNIEKRIERLLNLLNTIDKTINHYKEDTMALRDEELYEGFSKEHIERYNKEVDEKYGPGTLKASRERIGKLSKEQWQKVKDEGGAIALEIAKLMDRLPESPEVQKLVKRHHAWILNFWTPNAERYKGLGKGYVENPEFRVFYDKYKTGLAEFLSSAMGHYADTELDE